MLDSKRRTETRQTNVITILKGSVGAARKVSANWSQETITCHSSNWLLFRSAQLLHDRFKYCERFVFLVPVRSLLSSIVVPVYHVNDKLLCGRGKGRGVPPPHPFWRASLSFYYGLLRKLGKNKVRAFSQSSTSILMNFLPEPQTINIANVTALLHVVNR